MSSFFFLAGPPLVLVLQMLKYYSRQFIELTHRHNLASGQKAVSNNSISIPWKYASGKSRHTKRIHFV